MFNQKAEQYSVFFIQHSFEENKAYLHGLHDGLITFCHSDQDKNELFSAYDSWVNSLKLETLFMK